MLPVLLNLLHMVHFINKIEWASLRAACTMELNFGGLRMVDFTGHCGFYSKHMGLSIGLTAYSLDIYFFSE